MKKRIRQGILHAEKIARVGRCPVCQGTGRTAHFTSSSDWCAACGVTGRLDEYRKRKNTVIALGLDSKKSDGKKS